MNRKQVKNSGGDKKRFTRTATKTKKINIAPKISRGGIRLWIKKSKGDWGNPVAF